MSNKPRLLKTWISRSTWQRLISWTVLRGAVVCLRLTGRKETYSKLSWLTVYIRKPSLESKKPRKNGLRRGIETLSTFIVWLITEEESIMLRISPLKTVVPRAMMDERKCQVLLQETVHQKIWSQAKAEWTTVCLFGQFGHNVVWIWIYWRWNYGCLNYCNGDKALRPNGFNFKFF